MLILFPHIHTNNVSPILIITSHFIIVIYMKYIHYSLIIINLLDLVSLLRRWGPVQVWKWCSCYTHWNEINRIGGVMVSVLAWGVVDRGFKPRWGKTKDYKIITPLVERGLYCNHLVRPSVLPFVRPSVRPFTLS